MSRALTPRPRVVLATLLVIAALLVACDDGDATATPTGSPTAEATAAGPTATDTPAGASDTPTAEVVPIFAPLTVGEPVPLPDGVTLYVVDIAEGHGAGVGLARVRRAAGEVQVSRMWERPFQAAWMWDGAIYVSDCVAGVCAGEESSADASVSLHASDDDGRTWRSLGTRTGGDPDPRLWSDVLSGDAAAPVIDRSLEAEGVVVVEGVELDLAAIDLRAEPADGFDAYGLMGWPAVSEHGFAVSWYARVEAGEPPLRYLSVFASDGSPRGTFASNVIPVWLDAGRLVGTAVYGGEYPSLDAGEEVSWLPSIIELETKTIHPIVEPFAESPGTNVVIGLDLAEDD